MPPTKNNPKSASAVVQNSMNNKSIHNTNDGANNLLQEMQKLYVDAIQMFAQTNMIRNNNGKIN